MAGQADGDRPDGTVGGVGRASDDDRHRLVVMGVADGSGRRDQLVGDDALAPAADAAVSLLAGSGGRQPGRGRGVVVVGVLPESLGDQGVVGQRAEPGR